MKARFIIFLFGALFSLELHAQFGPENGVKASEPKFVLLQHATIMVKPGQTLTDCDLLMQDGKIVQVGKNLKQDGAVALDYTGKVLVPSFIDLYSSVGLDPVAFKNNGWRPQLESNKEGAYYWNEAVHQCRFAPSPHPGSCGYCGCENCHPDRRWQPASAPGPALPE
jgi:hypothetical protein